MNWRREDGTAVFDKPPTSPDHGKRPPELAGPRHVRVMLLEGAKRPGRRGVAVCTGEPPRGQPRRRCEWFVVGTYETTDGGLCALEVLPLADGRAIVHLDHENLQVVARDGRVVQCNATEDRLLS